MTCCQAVETLNKAATGGESKEVVSQTIFTDAQTAARVVTRMM